MLDKITPIPEEPDTLDQILEELRKINRKLDGMERKLENIEDSLKEISDGIEQIQEPMALLCEHSARTAKIRWLMQPKIFIIES